MSARLSVNGVAFTSAKLAYAYAQGVANAQGRRIAVMQKDEGLPWFVLAWMVPA
jgi:hypothetical protein